MTDRDALPALGQHLIIPPGLRVDISTEDSTELARHRRWRETVLFGAALSLFAAVFLVSLSIAFLTADVDAETRRSATAIVVTLIGALGGFLSGRAAK